MTSGDQFFTDGSAYEKLMGRWSRRVSEIFLQWIEVPQNLSWLDVGCGTGVFTEEIIKHCAPAAVTAIDSSADQLAFAKSRPVLEKVKFHIGDAQSLPFEDNNFDVTIMALVIHFVAKPVQAIAEAARVVRSNGWAASYVWDYSKGGSPTAPLVAALKVLGVQSPSPPSANETSLLALLKLWQGAGLKEIETFVINIPVEFADFDEFWNSISAPVGPAGKAITEMRPEVLEQLRTLLQKQVPIQTDGRVVYQACANAIKGRVKK
jgi:SAM-dependent methyltransferase